MPAQSADEKWGLKTVRGGPPRRTKLAGNDICFGKQIDFNFWGGKTAIFHSLPVTPLEA
jgi:hypothetical protein